MRSWTVWTYFRDYFPIRVSQQPALWDSIAAMLAYIYTSDGRTCRDNHVGTIVRGQPSRDNNVGTGVQGRAESC